MSGILSVQVNPTLYEILYYRNEKFEKGPTVVFISKR